MRYIRDLRYPYGVSMDSFAPKTPEGTRWLMTRVLTDIPMLMVLGNDSTGYSHRAERPKDL